MSEASRSFESLFLLLFLPETMTLSRERLMIPEIPTKEEAMEPLHPMPPLSAEIQLLLCCGGPGLQGRNRERLKRLCASHLDWDRLARVSQWHHMVPLLYWNLSHTEGANLPSEFMQLMKEAFLRSIRWSLTMTGELLTILEGMEDRGVLAVPYKGPVLASRLYGNLTLRQSADLDIVVRREDLEEARAVLIDQGYVPGVMLQGANHDFQVESRYSERFDRPGSIVELHWAFTNKDVAFPLSLNDLAPRLGSHQVSGRTVPVFSLEDTLLILCVHGAKHAWEKIEWICGVAEILHHDDPVDWEELTSRAIETRSLRRLLLGLCLTHDLYGAQLPDHVEELIRRDPQVRSLAVNVTANLFDGEPLGEGIHSFGSLDHDLFHFRLGDRVVDRWRYLLYRMTTPSRPERWSTITIRGRPVTLHAFTRPFSIVAKLVPAMWRRFGQDRSQSGVGSR